AVLFAQNTIIARNVASTAGADLARAANEVFMDRGGNLIGDVSTANVPFGTDPTSQLGTTAKPIDPLLGPLQNNGGPTTGFAALALPAIAPLPGTRATDRGGSAGSVAAIPGTDERGLVRPDAGKNELPDVGAFEFQDVALSVAVTPATASAPLGAADVFTVTVTNTGANALPADGSAVT